MSEYNKNKVVEKRRKRLRERGLVLFLDVVEIK